LVFLLNIKIIFSIFFNKKNKKFQINWNQPTKNSPTFCSCLVLRRLVLRRLVLRHLRTSINFLSRRVVVAGATHLDANTKQGQADLRATSTVDYCGCARERHPCKFSQPQMLAFTSRNDWQAN
jgi:hypothetical protein